MFPLTHPSSNSLACITTSCVPGRSCSTGMHERRRRTKTPRILAEADVPLALDQCRHLSRCYADVQPHRYHAESLRADRRDAYCVDARCEAARAVACADRPSDTRDEGAAAA